LGLAAGAGRRRQVSPELAAGSTARMDGVVPQSGQVGLAGKLRE